MTVDAVIFDWGGTLTPWHNVDVLAGWRTVAALVAPERADEVAAALHAAERDCWLRAEADQRSSTTRDIVAAAGLLAADDLLERALEAYLEAWEPHTFADPDASSLMRGLHERGVRVGVLSNTHWPREWHERIFARDGLLDLIDGAVYTSEIPWTKPHPDAFRAALAAVGVDDPGAAVFVGDRLFDDVHGAKCVGMRAVHVPHSDVPVYDVQPDATVARLGDVLALVDRWSAEERAG